MASIKVLKNEKNELEVKLLGERHSIPAMIRAELLKDKDVSFAAYKLEHPMDQDSLMIVKTKGAKTAKKALSDAIAAVDQKLEELDNALKAALK